VLLIAECLEGDELNELFELIEQLGMTALIELYDPIHLERVLATGTKLVGVNNRDLHTFAVDLEHVILLREQIPDDVVVVAESGIFTATDVHKIHCANIQAMLVGESLMRQHDIKQAVISLLQPSFAG
jgi:indole-3-glycerol phosphate synthase